ncbi:hypothetical protein A3711_15885 [Erythrobacter sp. HI00D59]|jgi:hypothetical protein|nr:hypothetical protein A3711_15885 [Erythrobacter sp. HI00D59]
MFRRSQGALGVNTVHIDELERATMLNPGGAACGRAPDQDEISEQSERGAEASEHAGCNASFSTAALEPRGVFDL